MTRPRYLDLEASPNKSRLAQNFAQLSSVVLYFLKHLRTSIVQEIFLSTFIARDTILVLYLTRLVSIRMRPNLDAK